MIDSAQDLPAYANNMDTDFKAEVMALSMMQYYHQANEVCIQRLGSRGRAKKKDISRIRKAIPEQEPGDIIIEVNRDGLYDDMPECVFHKPTLSNIGSGTSAAIAAIHAQRMQEADNRLFFRPFEQELSLQEIRMLHREQRIEDKGMYNNLLELLYPLWPLLQQLDTANARVFMHLLPFFYRTSGNKQWLAKLLQSLLRCPVSISEIPNKLYINKLAQQAEARNKILGVNMILCGSHFDGNTNWNVKIGPIDAQTAKDFLPGSTLNQLLQAIYENFAPEESGIEQTLDIRHHNFCIGKDAASAAGYLGYTTFL